MHNSVSLSLDLKYVFQFCFIFPLGQHPQHSYTTFRLLQAIDKDFIKALTKLHLKTVWNILKCRKHLTKKKGCVKWNLSKSLDVLKDRDSVHGGSSVRVFQVFWLLSIDRNALALPYAWTLPSYIVKKSQHFLGLLLCHSKPRESLISVGFGLSPYLLCKFGFMKTTKRNCPESRLPTARKNSACCHLTCLHSLVVLLVMTVPNQVMLSAPSLALADWPSGKAPRMGKQIPFLFFTGIKD